MVVPHVGEGHVAIEGRLHGVIQHRVVIFAVIFGVGTIRIVVVKIPHVEKHERSLLRDGIKRALVRETIIAARGECDFERTGAQWKGPEPTTGSRFRAEDTPHLHPVKIVGIGLQSLDRKRQRVSRRRRRRADRGKQGGLQRLIHADLEPRSHARRCKPRDHVCAGRSHATTPHTAPKGGGRLRGCDRDRKHEP